MPEAGWQGRHGGSRIEARECVVGQIGRRSKAGRCGGDAGDDASSVEGTRVPNDGGHKVQAVSFGRN